MDIIFQLRQSLVTQEDQIKQLNQQIQQIIYAQQTVVNRKKALNQQLLDTNSALIQQNQLLKNTKTDSETRFKAIDSLATNSSSQKHITADIQALNEKSIQLQQQLNQLQQLKNKALASRTQELQVIQEESGKK